MDVSSSQSLGPDNESRDLKCLLDIFASNRSHEDIASAYCRANGDVNAAGQILSNSQIGKTSIGTESGSGMVDCVQSGSSSEFNQPCPLTTSSRGSKPKKLSISTGLVSSVVWNATTSQPRSHPNVTKPLKLELKQPKLHVDATVSDINPNKKPLSNREIEDFLFSMLREGFNLDMDKIQEVPCSCGYNGKKGMEKLLELSSLNMVNDKDATCSDINMFAEKCLQVKPRPLEGELPKPSQLEDGKAKVSMEVLEALFANRKLSDEPPRRECLKLGLNRTRTFNKKVVSAPLIDVESTITTNIPEQQNSKHGKNMTFMCQANFTAQMIYAILPWNGQPYQNPFYTVWFTCHLRPEWNNYYFGHGVVCDPKSVLILDDDNYDVLRRAAKQHWDSMKTYYGAAFDAFAKREEREKIDYLLEQGKYHAKMARQTDERSAQLISARRTELDDVFTLDLHMHHSKEARSLLKSHLQSLAGIIQFLRVIVDSDAQDITKGRRKLAVINFLEKEHVQWSEEEGKPGTFLIQMDRKGLSEL